METKICIKCGIEKPLNKFKPYKSKYSSGFRNGCRKCSQDTTESKLYMSNYLKNYRLKDEIKEKRNHDYKLKKENDPIFALSEKYRHTILKACRNLGYKKGVRSFEILGCSYFDFKLYLESHFEPWMNWDNRGKYNGEFNFGWDIDHVIPLSSASSIEDMLKLNHFSNLKPLCSKINRDIKRDNLNMY